MIAQVRFDKIIKKSLFDALSGDVDGLVISPDQRVAISRYNSDTLEIIGSGCYYQSEVTQLDDGKYHLNNDMDKTISEYDVRKSPNEQYVVLTTESTVQIIDINMISTKYPLLQYKIEKAVPVHDNSVASLMETIGKLDQKINQISDSNFQFNAKCNVHVAGFGLISVKDVTYAEDMCTDDLQDMLNKGWRIIACCVQPDQRRPDYVFGRINIPE